jgi:HD domain
LYHEKFHYENTVLSMSQASRKFRTVDEAYQFLQELGAPPRLILHVQLVGEAADLLISHLHERQLKFDERLIRFGVVFHDVGKILHPSELKVAGNLHEADGERLLIEHGVEGRLARCCRSHSQWQKMECSLEELCVALADTLWKGKRIAALEEAVIQRLAVEDSMDYWDVFIHWDSCFERIASSGDVRLRRSYIS